MSNAKLLKDLFQSFSLGDDEAFKSTARKIINVEKSKKHHVLAADLEKFLESYSDKTGDPVVTLSMMMKSIPKDSDGTADLIEIVTPKISRSEVVYSDSNAKVLEDFIVEQKSHHLLRSHALKPNSRLLLCGPPGCGKSISAEMLASELGLPLVIVRIDSVVSSFLGETASNLRKIFDFIGKNRVVAFFDEFDALAKERSNRDEHGELKRVVNSFLQMMDGYKGNSVIVAATNHEGDLDRALWRRFDEVLKFDNPTTNQIRDLLEIKLKNFLHDIPLKSNEFILQFEGFSYADIERIVYSSAKKTILSNYAKINRQTMEEVTYKEMKRKDFVKDMVRAGGE
ncbi:ATP-binding protein [Halomonas sp. DP5N14-9]|uniref:AAA family ATPase n=1 Tax=Halomonas sp. DP5N14-9 TaxID=2859075 RepID=UPI001C995960|nr:ATP-binding protein [Halomonas sp. DP5N14-9]MBY5940404.1 ATP-binding protein [Halomonas sp. DP5N14-9]